MKTMMGKPAKILLASMLVAIISISITGYVYAETVTYQDVDVNRINEHVIIKSANFSSTVDTISISWEAPVNEPKDYRVTWIEATEDKYHSYKLVDGNNAYPTVSSYTIEDLEEDTEYKIKIRPRYHEASPGPWTDSVFISTGVTIPEPTTITTIPDPDDHAMEVAQMHNHLNDMIDEANALIKQIRDMTAHLDLMNGGNITLGYPAEELSTHPDSYVVVNGTEFTAGDTVQVTTRMYHDLMDHNSEYVDGTFHWINTKYVIISVRSFDNWRLSEELCYTEQYGTRLGMMLSFRGDSSVSSSDCIFNNDGTISTTWTIPDGATGQFSVTASSETELDYIIIHNETVYSERFTVN